MTRHSSTMVLSRTATFIALLVFLIDSALCQSSSNDTLEITTTRPSSSLELETTISPIDDQIIEITTLEPSSTLERETTISPIEDRTNNSTSEAAAILPCGSDTSNNNGTVKSKRETYEANFSLKAIQRALEDAFPGNDEKQLGSMSQCIYNATVEVEKFLSDLLASVKGDNSSSNNSKSDTGPEDNKKPAVNQQLDAIQKASLSIQSVFNSPDIQKELTGLLKSLVNIEKFNKDVSDIIDKLKDILDDVSKKLRENSSNSSPNTSKVEEPVDEAEARPIDSDDDDEPIVEDEDVLEPAKVSRDAPKFNCSSPLQYAIKVLSMDQDTDQCGAKSADPAQRCPCVTLLVEPSGSSSQAQSKC